MDNDFEQLNADIPLNIGEGEVIPPGGGAGAPQPMAPPVGIELSVLTMTFGILFDMFAMMAGKGGEFWALSEQQKNNLGSVWLGPVNDLLAAWGYSGNGKLELAIVMTVVTIGPRLALEKKRRESGRDTTATASSGASHSSAAPPAPESPDSPIDLSPEAIGV